jgi:O-antigen ligase
VTSLVVRAAVGAGLACFTVPALFVLPLLASAAAIGVMALTMWRPIAGLTAAVAVAPAGLLLAPAPARTAELLVWGFLCAWVLSLWRPLAMVRARSTVFLPAVLFALWATASWVAYIVGGAAGVEPLMLPALVARAVPLDHLVFSSPEPETFTLLPLLAGLALFGAAAIAARQRPEARFAVAAAIVVSAAALAVLTMADVLGQWASADYGGWFLLRYVRGERFSLHLRDLNAAGSHYVLGMLVAVALAIGDRRRRAIWMALAILIAPALGIAGSRSAALGGLLVGGSVIPLMRREASRRIARRDLVLAAIAVMVLAVGAALLASRPGGQGTASNALWLRAQFLVTSTRMVASAPVFGVGIGHYHERSNEFMPAALRQVYPHENAHNYFAQQFAELGVLGGVLFMWLVAAGLWTAWREAGRSTSGSAASIGLLAGCGGYVLTCVTGHPLLVPETAMPFWGAFGVLAGAAVPSEPSPLGGNKIPIRRWAIAIVVAAACANVVLNLRRYGLTTAMPGERGFYDLQTTEDGTVFVWMTRHGMFYVGPQPGTVTIPVRAPNFLTDAEPFRVAVEVGGRRIGVFDAMPDRWTNIEIPVRRPASGPFRRIDLRANRSWSPMRDRGERVDDQPRSVMVGTTRWTPAGAR